MYDEHIKSRLIKDIRFFREIKDQNDHKVFHIFFLRSFKSTVEYISIPLIPVLCFIVLHRYCIFYKSKVYGKSVL